MGIRFWNSASLQIVQTYQCWVDETRVSIISHNILNHYAKNTTSIETTQQAKQSQKTRDRRRLCKCSVYYSIHSNPTPKTNLLHFSSIQLSCSVPGFSNFPFKPVLVRSLSNLRLYKFTNRVEHKQFCSNYSTSNACTHTHTHTTHKWQRTEIVWPAITVYYYSSHYAKRAATPKMLIFSNRHFLEESYTHPCHHLPPAHISQ